MTQRRIYITSSTVTEDGARDGSKLVPARTVLAVVRGMSLAKEFRVAITRPEMTFNQGSQGARAVWRPHVRGQAQPYQVAQFLKRVEGCGLELESK